MDLDEILRNSPTPYKKFWARCLISQPLGYSHGPKQPVSSSLFFSYRGNTFGNLRTRAIKIGSQILNFGMGPHKYQKYLLNYLFILHFT
jgi:hypothetical protein